MIVRDFFYRREWSFTIENDIYIRYQCFSTKEELMKGIQQCKPHKIDIGAVFTAPPKDHNTIKPELFKPEERELVFDIDMTDYDDIRQCCTGANICKKCWPYMTMALKCVDCALRDDFGFKHILWIYSGRRGIHCWVNDSQARELSNEARTSIVEYLTGAHTSDKENTDKKLNMTFAADIYDPMIRRSYDILEPYFENYIADNDGQGLLATKKNYMPILNSIPDSAESLRRELYDTWEGKKNITGAERWRQLKEAIEPKERDNSKHTSKKAKIDEKVYKELKKWKHELVFLHCYPRLDANVSTHQNHLLKSPFCVHPKTGRVCIPIDPSQADSFDPFKVPTLRSLLSEIDGYDGVEDISDIEKTSMKKAIETFDKCLMNGLRDTIRKDLKSERMSAIEGIDGSKKISSSSFSQRISSNNKSVQSSKVVDIERFFIQSSVQLPSIDTEQEDIDISEENNNLQRLLIQTAEPLPYLKRDDYDNIIGVKWQNDFMDSWK